MQILYIFSRPQPGAAANNARIGLRVGIEPAALVQRSDKLSNSVHMLSKKSRWQQVQNTQPVLYFIMNLFICFNILPILT
jgi:hypothetical protein